MNKSYLTAIKRNGASVPLKFLAGKNLINASQTILDFGCGHGADVAWLKNNGYIAYGFDPYWNINLYALKNRYDIVLCTYVLNVVDQNIRNDVLKKLKSLVTSHGKIYVTVRRDFKKDYITKKGTQQYIVKLPYKIVKENSQYCIYEIKAQEICLKQ